MELPPTKLLLRADAAEPVLRVQAIGRTQRPRPALVIQQRRRDGFLPHVVHVRAGERGLVHYHSVVLPRTPRPRVVQRPEVNSTSVDQANQSVRLAGGFRDRPQEGFQLAVGLGHDLVVRREQSPGLAAFLADVIADDRDRESRFPPAPSASDCVESTSLPP